MSNAKKSNKLARKAYNKAIKAKLRCEYNAVIKAIDEAASNGGNFIDLETLPFEVHKKLLKKKYVIEPRLNPSLSISIYW